MPTEDEYQSFAELSFQEQEGLVFTRIAQMRSSPIAVIAPHGGGIEPGTSELTLAIAGSQFSYYVFEALQSTGNERLHITSTQFDEPLCLQVVSDVQTVVSIHGCANPAQVVYVGGLDRQLKAYLIDILSATGFDAKQAKPPIAALQPDNICNRGRSGQGVQLEVSDGLRKAMFQGLTRRERKLTTHVFDQFVQTVHSSLKRWEERQM